MQLKVDTKRKWCSLCWCVCALHAAVLLHCDDSLTDNNVTSCCLEGRLSRLTTKDEDSDQLFTTVIGLLDVS